MEFKIVKERSESWARFVELEVINPGGGKNMIEPAVMEIAAKIMGDYPNWEVSNHRRARKSDVWVRFKDEWRRCFSGEEDVKSGDLILLRIQVYHWSSDIIKHACELK